MIQKIVIEKNITYLSLRSCTAFKTIYNGLALNTFISSETTMWMPILP